MKISALFMKISAVSMKISAVFIGEEGYAYSMESMIFFYLNPKKNRI